MADADVDRERLETLSNQVIGASLRVHRELGPGLLESAYDHCLYFELVDMGLSVERQVPVPIIYRGRQLECGYRLDLLVERVVIIEVKAVDKLLPVHTAQLLSHLRLRRLKLGLLLNFHEQMLKTGIKRVVNGFPG